jgi:hypothetical protein
MTIRDTEQKPRKKKDGSSELSLFSPLLELIL